MGLPRSLTGVHMYEATRHAALTRSSKCTAGCNPQAHIGDTIDSRALQAGWAWMPPWAHFPSLLIGGTGCIALIQFMIEISLLYGIDTWKQRDLIGSPGRVGRPSGDSSRQKCHGASGTFVHSLWIRLTSAPLQTVRQLPACFLKFQPERWTRPCGLQVGACRAQAASGDPFPEAFHEHTSD